GGRPAWVALVTMAPMSPCSVAGSCQIHNPLPDKAGTGRSLEPGGGGAGRAASGTRTGGCHGGAGADFPGGVGGGGHPASGTGPGMAGAGGPGALGAGTAEPWAEAIWPARAGDQPATARLPAVDWCLTGARPDFATMSTPA